MGHSGVAPVTGAGVYKGRVGVAGVGVVGVVVRVAVGSNVEVGSGVADGVGDVGDTSGVGVSVGVVTLGDGVGDIGAASGVGVADGMITAGDGVNVGRGVIVTGGGGHPRNQVHTKPISTATAANAVAGFFQTGLG